MALSQDEQRNTSLALQAGGTAVGSYWGPIGASVGAAVGNVAAQGVNLLFGEQDQVKGPSGQQRSLAAMAMEQAQRTSELRGISQQQAARMAETGAIQGRQLLQMMNALEFQNLSALEKDVLSENIVEKTRARQVEVSRAISTADVDATSRSLSEARQATQAAAAQAAQIRAQEVAQEKEQKRVQAVAEENFIKAVGQTTEAAAKFAAHMDKKKKDKDDEERRSGQTGLVGALGGSQSPVFAQGTGILDDPALSGIGEISDPTLASMNSVMSQDVSSFLSGLDGFDFDNDFLGVV